MRILLTTDPIGGVWNYVLELCAALRPLHTAIALATLGRPLTRAQHEQLAELEHVTVYESSYRLEWMPQPWDDLARAAEWLLDIEKKFNPDVIHLNHLVHADLPWRAPVVTVGHSCVLSWWKAVRGTPIDAQWSTYLERVTASLRAAACVVAPTHAMLTALEDSYGPFRNSAVIHNARNGRHFSPRQKQPLILCAGRLWDAAKNVRVLTAIAPRIKGRIAVAGEDVGPDGARAEISGVELLGSLSPAALAWWYARASIYALPARYEPFGLTALEAAWSGCALVLGDIESLREVWGAAACYVSPDDPEGWCEVLNGLLQNDSLRKRMGARAMARARQFSPVELGASYRDIYRNLECDLRSSTTR